MGKLLPGITLQSWFERTDSSERLCCSNQPVVKSLECLAGSLRRTRREPTPLSRKASVGACRHSESPEQLDPREHVIPQAWAWCAGECGWRVAPCASASCALVSVAQGGQGGDYGGHRPDARCGLGDRELAVEIGEMRP